MSNPEQYNKWHQKRVEKGDTPGGGFIVLRRGQVYGRVSINKGSLPFEHATYEAALQECVRLAARHPGRRFDVWRAIPESSTLIVEEDRS